MHNNEVVPYEINENIYQRFEAKNHMIYRRTWDKSLPTYGKMFEENIENHIHSKKEGYSRIDFALVAAGWTIYERFPFAFVWERETNYDIGYGINWMLSPYLVNNIKVLTQAVKKAAKFKI